jgi:hypothetical protein
MLQGIEALHINFSIYPAGVIDLVYRAFLASIFTLLWHRGH